MNDDVANLIRAIKQAIQGERLLGCDFLTASTMPLSPVLAGGGAGSAPAKAYAPPVSAMAGSSRSSDRNPSPAKPAAPKVAPLGPVGPVLTREQKIEALAKIKEEAARCLACQLGKGRTNLVFGEGDAGAQLVFVGEAPGEEEDNTGRPFVGRAGQKLTEMIQAMGLRREDVYICNILKCRPPNNRPPAPEEVVVCWPFLVRQLQILRPKVIVTLGNPATQNLLNTREGITKLRGQWQELPNIGEGLEGTAVMPTFHPSYVIRNYTPQVRGLVWSDLQQVMEKLGIKPRK